MEGAGRGGSRRGRAGGVIDGERVCVKDLELTHTHAQEHTEAERHKRGGDTRKGTDR